MKGSAVEKTAVGIVVFMVLAIIGVLGLGAWAFIELILWITSK